MSITSGYNKYKRYTKLSDGTYKLVSQWTNSNTVEMDNGSTLQATLGNTSISGIGDGTVTGAIDSLNSNKVRLLKLTSIDDYSGSANSLSFGVFDSLGYVTINIEGWIFIQFKIDASKSIFIRGRYGANGWGPFVKLWA